MLIKCTAKPSQHLQNYGETLATAEIAHAVETTKRDHDLFCYVGTDIFVHGYIEGHCNPDRPRRPEKELPDGLKYGSTYVVVNKGKWVFSGDFQHCAPEDIRHNAKLLRAKLEELIAKHSKAKPFCMAKAYDGDCYLYTKDKKKMPVIEFGSNLSVSVESIEYLEKHNSFQDWSELESYEEENTYRKSQIEKHKQEMKRHKDEMKCPICANREYLENLGELKPEITGDKETDYHLAMNYDYFTQEDPWARNWIVLKNKWEVEHTPKCTKCGNPIFTNIYFGTDSWLSQINKGVCYNCDPEYQRKMREDELERKKRIPPKERLHEELEKTAKLTKFLS